jgi:acetyl esterase/lipase
LFIPKGVRDGAAPGVIALHQTVLEGKGEPAGLTPNKNQHYGLELAKRGYVVLAPDYPSFGEYAYDFDKDDYQSGTMKGIFDHLRAVDLLTSLKEVDPTRIGAIGHSLGGHNAIFLGAFDERVKVVVSCCGWTSFAKYYGGDLTGWTSARYMPRIRTAYNLDPARMPFDFNGTIAAIAPRAFLSISPLHDDNFAVEGVRQTMAEVEPVYALVAALENLHVEYPDCKHDFPPEMRAKAYEFIERALRPAAASPSSPAPAK